MWGEGEKKLMGIFLSACTVCCDCALRANVTTCREDRHPPALMGVCVFLRSSQVINHTFEAHHEA